MTSTAATTPTKAIYQLDETLRKHVTQVVRITPLAGLDDTERGLFKVAADSLDASAISYHVIETKETIFYAQGGGQPFDTGHMSSPAKGKFKVDAVRYGKDGRILHFGAYEDGPTAEQLAVGDMVEQHIDSKRRDDNSRCHTAGHIIGLSVRRLTEKEKGLENTTELKAAHYPDASFVEFQGLIDGKHKAAIQTQATEYVKQALPIKLHWYKPEELSPNGVITAEGMPIVAGPDGHVRVVDIVGAGAYPCGGTHVQDTSLVGNIVVRTIKRQKGITKISYGIS